MNKKEILRDYLELSCRADLTLEVLEEREAHMSTTDIECFEARLAKLNADLAKIEDDNPWITKVLTVLEIG